MNDSICEPRRQILLAEYGAAHASFHHYDSFRWQSGSMLIGSSLILWGFMLSKDELPEDRIIVAASVLVSTLMASWLLFAHHYRQLYVSKLHRIHEIESELGMTLNLNHGFLGLTTVCKYPKSGPKGHYMDIAVFIIISLFGPIIVSLSSGWSWLYISPICIVLLASFWVCWDEKKMKHDYESMLTWHNNAKNSEKLN